MPLQTPSSRNLNQTQLSRRVSLKSPILKPQTSPHIPRLLSILACLRDRLSCTKTTSGLRRILHKLKKQKRQSRMIEKIFSSQKEKRSESDVIEDPLLIKPTV
jgi:hypothetical protein